MAVRDEDVADFAARLEPSLEELVQEAIYALIEELDAVGVRGA